MIRKVQDKANKIYVVFFTLFLSITHIFEISSYFKLNINLGFIIVLTLLVVVYAVFMDMFRGKMVRTAIMIATIAIAVIAGVVLFVKNPYIFSDILSWCISYGGDISDYQPLYAYLIMVFMLIILTGVLYAVISSKLCSDILAAIYIGLIIIMGIFSYQISKVSLGIMLIYIFLTVASLCGRYLHKTKNITDNPNAKAFLLPVCIIFGMLIMILPSKTTPIEWKTIKRFIQSTADFVENIRFELSLLRSGEDGSFGIAIAGFSDGDGELGGNLGNSNRIALFVEIKSSETKYPLYLTGTVNDIYTGKGWKKAEESYHDKLPDYFLNYLEAVFPYRNSAIDEIPYLRNQSIRITYENLQSKSMFLPVNTRNIAMLTKDEIKKPIGENVYFRRARREDTSYRISNYMLYTSSDELVQLLREIDQFDYSNVDSNDFAILIQKDRLLQPYSLLRTYNPSVADVKELFIKRAADIKKRYTKLPEKLPDRVYRLAEQITEPYDNNYDKLKAIEAYLNEYSYTKRPAKIAKDQDFVDGFLFDTKEGYCTYFASAMAVLGRCIGIPTRYVEGYICYFDEKVDSQYAIRNQNAHAWMEAYFEGVGWVAFEPSTGYGEYRYVAVEEKQEAVSRPKVEYDYRPSMTSETKKKQEALMKQINQENNSTAIIFVMCGIGVCILLAGILYLVITIRYKRKYKDYSIEEKIQYQYERIMQCYVRRGFKRVPSETLLAYANRIMADKELSKLAGETFLGITNHYMRMYYGKQNMTNQELIEFNTFLLALHNSLLHRRDKFIFWLDSFTFMLRI